MSMKVYLASSWKNMHAVEMLTHELRYRGHTVVSFIEEACIRERRGVFDINEWIKSDDGLAKFKFDTNGATTSDLVIYVGPSGTDAWAEVGAAWASKVPVYGLYAKGEPAGLMRRMIKWFHCYRDLLEAVEKLSY